MFKHLLNMISAASSSPLVKDTCKALLLGLQQSQEPHHSCAPWFYPLAVPPQVAPTSSLPLCLTPTPLLVSCQPPPCPLLPATL
jgi:hypothetical protein